MLKKLSIYVLILYSLLFSLIVFKDLKTNLKVVATIDGKKIHMKDIQETINDEYFKLGLNQYIERYLLSEAAKDIDKPNSNQLKLSYENYAKLYKRVGVFEEEQSNVEKFYYLTELMKKYSIKDSNLNNYAKNTILSKGDKVAQVKKVVASKEMISNIVRDLKNKETIENIQSNYNLILKKEKIYKLDSKYDLNFNELLNNKYTIISASEEDMEDVHESCMYSNQNELDTLFIVDSIEDNNIENINKDKNELIDNYITDNYYKELATLINILKSKNNINIIQ